MLKLTDLVLMEVNKGLSKAGNIDADIKCYETFINNLPNGKGTKENTVVYELKNVSSLRFLVRFLIVLVLHQ